MKILFDQGVPKKLRQHSPGHEARTAYEAGLHELQNSALLREAEKSFDVLLTTDSNIKFQQRISDYNIAMIGLRAFTNSLEDYLPLVPELLTTLEKVGPGEIEYLYADEKLRRRDELKGQKKQQ